MKHVFPIIAVFLIACAASDAEFKVIDKWYTFEAPTGDDFIILAGLDESS